MEKIVLRFDGKLASSGQMHYYEYSRSQYATARFISTIEHFRRTLIVPERITSSVRAEILVETPKDGSFLEILLLKAQEGAATAISAPIGGLISLVWNNLLPRTEKTDADVVELARIRLREEEQRTIQDQQETERLRIIQQIVNSQSATTDQALQLVKESMNNPNPALAEASLLQPRLLEMQTELEAESERQKEIAPHLDEFSEINNDKIIKLNSRLRSIVPDMAFPLNKSAESLSISKDTGKQPLILVSPTTVSQITEKQIDDDPSEFVAHVRSFDRDRNVGKITSPQLSRQLNFIVSPADASWLRPKVLEAMDTEYVTFVGRFYRDRDGTETSIILDDIGDYD